MFLVIFCNLFISELNAPPALPLQMKPTPVFFMHCYEGVEVWHSKRRNKPARFTSLQVVQTANTTDCRERQWTPEA